MSKRLTSAAREEIRDRLLDRAFGEEEQQLKNENARLFEAVIDATWGDHLTAVNSIPADLLGQNDDCWIGNDRSGYWLRLSGHQCRPVTQCRNHDVEALPVALGSEIRAYAARSSEFSERKKVARAGIEAVLASVTTYNRLYEIWPELKEVVPVIEQPTGKALAINLADLNRSLKLGEAV